MRGEIIGGWWLTADVCLCNHCPVGRTGDEKPHVVHSGNDSELIRAFGAVPCSFRILLLALVGCEGSTVVETGEALLSYCQTSTVFSTRMCWGLLKACGNQTAYPCFQGVSDWFDGTPLLKARSEI